MVSIERFSSAPRWNPWKFAADRPHRHLPYEFHQYWNTAQLRRASPLRSGRRSCRGHCSFHLLGVELPMLRNMLGTHCSSLLTDPIAAYRTNFTNIGIFPGYVELPSCSVPVLSVLPSDTWVKSEHSPGPHPEPGHVFKLCPRSKSAVFFSANNQLTDNCAELFQK